MTVSGVADPYVLACRRCPRRAAPRGAVRGVAGGELHGAALGRGSSRCAMVGAPVVGPTDSLSLVDDGDVLDVHVRAREPRPRRPWPCGRRARRARSRLPRRAPARRGSSFGVTVTSADGGGEEPVEGAGDRVREDQAARDERHGQDTASAESSSRPLCARKLRSVALSTGQRCLGPCRGRRPGRGTRVAPVRRCAPSGACGSSRDSCRRGSCVPVPPPPSAAPSRPRSARPRGRAPGRSGRRRPGRG